MNQVGQFGWRTPMANYGIVPDLEKNIGGNHAILRFGIHQQLEERTGCQLNSLLSNSSVEVAHQKHLV